jgi:hypothetical protein
MLGFGLPPPTHGLKCTSQSRSSFIITVFPPPPLPADAAVPAARADGLADAAVPAARADGSADAAVPTARADDGPADAAVPAADGAPAAAAVATDEDDDSGRDASSMSDYNPRKPEPVSDYCHSSG